jgi:hypothetical protein
VVCERRESVHAATVQQRELSDCSPEPKLLPGLRFHTTHQAAQFEVRHGAGMSPIS